MDDTNPTKEETEYVDSITEDVNWLIAGWADHVLGLKAKGKTEPFYASDYFEQFFEYAVQLIAKGKAYVDDQPQEEMRAARGTLTERALLMLRGFGLRARRA